ncbi:MAG TPA: sulfurtransferase TusA family protein [Chitinispirillaceae bacterium]|jgi:sulfite reductase (ferredoxin)|nr:sulfurtransferase TusA family protein [Chitinispirillaceae bacterium]
MQIEQSEIFRDYRGIECPMNFARITVDLMDLNIGDKIRVLIDDGEPSVNVPRSLEREGQKVIYREKRGDYWELVVEKRVE